MIPNYGFRDYFQYDQGDILMLGEDRFTIIDKGRDFSSKFLLITGGTKCIRLRSDKHIEWVRGYNRGNRSIRDY